MHETEIASAAMPKQVLEQISAFHEAAVWDRAQQLVGEVSVNSRGRGVFIGTSGFFAGTLVASVVSWSPLPKAALVVVAAVLVSTTAWAVTRPRSAP